MTHDPMAHERLRTILNSAADDAWVEDDFSQRIGDIAADQFPEARFERQVNEHGVAVRRVVAVTEWEVDPGVVRASGADR